MDEILYGGMLNARQLAVLNLAFLVNAGAREALPNHEVFTRCYKLLDPGESSGGVDIPVVPLDGTDRMAPVGEGVDIANTAVTVEKIHLDLARWGLAYEAGDLARATDGIGVLNTNRMAMNAVKSKANTWAYGAMNVIDDYTTTVGTPGSAFTLPNYQAAVYTLDALAIEGAKLAMLATKQWFDIEQYFTVNAGGAAQYHPAAQRAIDLNGPGLKGDMMGATIWVSNNAQTKNAGVDVAGGIVAPGALAMIEGQIPNDGDPNMILLGTVENDNNGRAAPGRLVLDRIRQGRGGRTAWVASTLMAIAMGLDARGVSIITKRAL